MNLQLTVVGTSGTNGQHVLLPVGLVHEAVQWSVSPVKHTNQIYIVLALLSSTRHVTSSRA